MAELQKGAIGKECITEREISNDDMFAFLHENLQPKSFAATADFWALIPSLIEFFTR